MRKQSMCSAYDNTKKKPVCIRVACTTFATAGESKQRAEQREEVTTSYNKNLQYVGDDEKTGKKKHDKNKRERREELRKVEFVDSIYLCW